MAVFWFSSACQSLKFANISMFVSCSPLDVTGWHQDLGLAEAEMLSMAAESESLGLSDGQLRCQFIIHLPGGKINSTGTYHCVQVESSSS